MTSAFEKALGATERSVETVDRDGVAMRRVRLKRSFKTDPPDLWDALTNQERLPRWFLPVSGDLHEGGRYQLKGNAGGEILVCDPPSQLSLSWEFGESTSWVDVFVTLNANNDALLILDHTVPADGHWDQYGPGATGVGWDLGLNALRAHLGMAHERFGDNAWMETDEYKAFARECSAAWGEADLEGGEAAASARKKAQETAKAYAGEAAGDT